MTNFELNKKLAELLGIERYVTSKNECMNRFFFKANVLEVEEFSPCTNWNDIMPIAVELGVSLLPVIDCNGGRSYSVGVANFKKGSWDVLEDEEAFLFEDYHDTNPQIALTKCCIAVLKAK